MDAPIFNLLSHICYKVEKDLYDREWDELDKLQTWMTKTVAPNYVQTCFDYSEGISEWYGKLKEQVSINEHTIKREIKAPSRIARHPLVGLYRVNRILID
jgi:hypothetical protein